MRHRRAKRNPSATDILLFAGVGLGGYLLYKSMTKPAVATTLPATQSQGLTNLIGAAIGAFKPGPSPASAPTPPDVTAGGSAWFDPSSLFTSPAPSPAPTQGTLSGTVFTSHKRRGSLG